MKFICIAKVNKQRKVKKFGRNGNVSIIKSSVCSINFKTQKVSQIAHRKLHHKNILSLYSFIYLFYLFHFLFYSFLYFFIHFPKSYKNQFKNRSYPLYACFLDQSLIVNYLSIFHIRLGNKNFK